MKLVLIPLKKELESLISVLNGIRKNEYGYVYKDYQFVIGGMGKLNFALSTYKFGQFLKPTELFAVGSCGALRAFDLLEVVVVDKVVEYDFESSFMKAPEFENEIEGFKGLKRVFCASGDNDVITSSDKEALLQKTNADVVTWESASFFKAADLLELPYTEIRVVTDAADDTATADFKKNISSGMQKLGLLFK